MSSTNLLQGKFESFLDNGDPNSGGTVTLYVADGTYSATITTYTTYEMNVANPASVTLDAAGRAVVYFDGDADIRVKDSLGTTIYSQRNINYTATIGSYYFSTNTTLTASHASGYIQTTGSVTLTFTAAATLATGWYVTIVNADAANNLILARANAGDKFNGTAANLTIPPNSSVKVQVSYQEDGFWITSAGNVAIYRAPTPSPGTSDTQIATTAFVTTADNLKADLASPTFTGTVTLPTTNITGVATIQNVVPQYVFIETDAAAENKRWDFTVNGESLAMRAVNDANSAATDFVSVQRTGTTIDSVTITGTAVNVTGNLSVSGTADTILTVNGGTGYGSVKINAPTGQPSYLFFHENNVEHCRISVTTGSDALLFHTGVGATTRGRIQAGLIIGSPTGDDKGAGSINAETIYVNGVAIGGINVQTFTSTGANTWTKPSGLSTDAQARIQCWAGGGSGAGNGLPTGVFPCGGGGGGAYRERWMKLSDLGSTETATVGAGGAAVGATANGNAGGASTFGAHLSAPGGAGGTNAGDGGAGGGDAVWGGGGVGGISGTSNAGNGINWEGAGGGGRNTSAGNAAWAGGGGVGDDAIGGAFGSPGTSVWGGAGGGLVAAGTVPSGGGGCGSGNTASGAGANGKIIVTVFS